MLYSVRMRAAQGGPHEAGGRHISGAERIAGAGDLAALATEMLTRALAHSRGRADFINITVEAINAENVRRVPLLPVTTVAVPDVAAGREAAVAQLIKAGVAPAAARQGLAALLGLADSMRGAMLVCAESGRRLDNKALRGVRVSRMDAADPAGLTAFLSRRGLNNAHVREALVLAAKVAAAPGVVAELCWSDDPEYTAGYVASSQGYYRFPYLKPYGSPVGGRVFFVAPGCDQAALIEYLERQPVLVTAPEEESECSL
ncbi:6-carboxyhexanoate--CoA ligase [Thermosinus carboxydivorans Nor1]|uniref:6-carboxyhexanoate--CoA ligase n=1 Tax=Thermosinus carboxydivorans Nor1 TaxID=401526 RepID=A1HTZ5_9FIRM|nr:6-carboxyhexanoate--CoA ligase [Thermosinus carboxydivorans]EAX46516.1 6-carboxyhexanoate--CoA ligase [Thermosinus carboxydivorans Nor1]